MTSNSTAQQVLVYTLHQQVQTKFTLRQDNPTIKQRFKFFEAVLSQVRHIESMSQVSGGGSSSPFTDFV